jgi:glutamate-ammonia-ligase adenylyltransferase
MATDDSAAISQSEALPSALHGAVEGQIKELQAQLTVSGAAAMLVSLPRVVAASEFVAHTCTQHPEVLAELIRSGDLERGYTAGWITTAVQHATGTVTDDAGLKQALRLIRRREMVRIAWRDIAGWADLEEVTYTLTELAESCLDAALTKHYGWATQKYGVPKSEESQTPQQLVVLGMGKLGGRELNFSSDIDLILCYPEEGTTDGDRTLSNHEFFIRLGQALINALNETTCDGFVFRVDMRLRPNGASGPLALSFDAMEHYYQTHGREWERYALIKARVVAGDRGRGEELLARLKPFVFRKYLDFNTLDGIRSMKLMIEREIERKGMRANVKLGPGGIREIEFLAQALQLIRGGREPRLQHRALLKVLPVLAERGDLTLEQVEALASAYIFLRNTEHRLQMLADRQTQMLPDDALERLRVAVGMGFNDWESFAAALNRHRQRVQEIFAQMFAAPQGEGGGETAADLLALWQGTLEPERAIVLLNATGFSDAAPVLALLEGLRTSSAYQSFSAEGRARMDRLLPLLLAAAGLTHDPGTTMTRLTQVLEAIGRRSTYLALLIENPMALSQFVKLVAASPWISNWIASHPIVLDELLDPVRLYAPLTRAELRDELRARLAHIPAEDLELQMDILREFRHGHVLRVAAADVGPGLAPEEVGANLANLAAATLEESLALAYRSLTEKHGRPRCPDGAEPGFAIIGYGKLGSLELGYASDLDIVFVYQGCENGATERGLPNEAFFARLGQRLIHIITTRTSGGILYEVDMRLRPSGKSGPLVSSLDAFRHYQTTQAWTWEHQALVRARAVAGDARTAAAFAAIRREILTSQRDIEKLRADVVEMRTRMAQSHPGAKDPAEFDLKHDRGGIVDIEFMVQYAVLRWAPQYPGLAAATDNLGILGQLAEQALWPAAHTETLAQAYRRYLSMEHKAKLMERGSCVARTEVGDWPEKVRRIWDEVFSEKTE